jgi:hypothetical protein
MTPATNRRTASISSADSEGKVYAAGIQTQTLVCPPGKQTRRRAEEGAPSRTGCDLGEASRA